MNGEPYWFSRITPRPDLGYRQIVTLGDLDSYGQHQALWKLFGVAKNERTDRTEFLFRTEQQKGLPVVHDKKERTLYEAERWIKRRKCEQRREKPVTKKRTRHDAVMDAKTQMCWKDVPADERPTLAHLAYEAGTCWLRDRKARLGCTFESKVLGVDGYRTWRMQSRKNIELSALDFEGILTVTDQQRFLDALLLGIGPAKAFGGGLLLVRRI